MLKAWTNGLKRAGSQLILENILCKLVAMALAQETTILLLDEPTTFLDIAHQIEILELLTQLNRDENRTIVLVLHDLNQASRWADHLVALSSGRIISQGAPAEVVTPELVERVFHLGCIVMEDPVSGSPLVIPVTPTARS